MKFTKSLVVLLAVLTIIGCRKDIDGVSTQTTVSPPIPVLQETSLQGLIVDQNDQPIAGAKVDFINISKTSDENGYFKFESIDINEDGFLTTFKKDGYFEGYKFVFPSESNQTYVKVMLIEQGNPLSFNATSGGTIEVDGASVSFKENSIVTESNNQAYTGNVNAYVHWYEPGVYSTALSMPGDLRGINLENQPVSLSTYGMVAVELYDDNGNKLNLAPNTTATLSMEAPDVNTLPGVMPTWSMNEENGFWEEEGEASLINGMYVAEVSHFSFWNCDDPYTLVFIDGLIQTTDNFPLSNAYIKIRIIGTSQCGGGYTNADGQFSGYVPKDQALEMTIYDECGDEVYTGPLGSFSDDTSLPPTFVNLENELMTIKGSVVCQGDAVTSGYVKIAYGDDNYTYVDIDTDGSFEVHRLLCAVNISSISLFAINTDLGTTSDEIVTDSIVNNIIDVGQVDACEIEFDEWVNYNIDGTDYTPIYFIQEAGFGLPGLTLTAQNPDFGGTVRFIFQDPKEGNNNPWLSVIGNQDIVGSVLCSFGNCTDLNVTITKYETFEGGYVEGFFDGESFIDGSQIVTVSGDFRVQLDYYVPTAKVYLNRFIDEDMNGIFTDVDGPDQTANISGFTTDLIQDSEELDFYTTNGDDLYAYVEAEKDFYFAAILYASNLSDNYAFTLYNIGDDDSIDNDFKEDGTTEIFNLQEGVIKTDISLGVIRVPSIFCNSTPNLTEFTCDGNGTQLSLTPTNGTGPYTYQWSTGETTQEIIVFDDGQYTATVTDATGAFCNETFNVFYIGNTSLQYNTINPTCGESNGSIEILNESEFGDIIWSDGFEGSFIAGLAAGTYNYEAFDQNGCYASGSVTLSNQNTVIGNQVWVDVPGGVANAFDSGDRALEGVIVNLLDASNLEVVATETTDNLGNYLITGEYAGEYIVEFILPNGYEFVENINEVSNPDNSDVNPDTGRTGIFEIECGEFILYIDAGVIE